LVNLAASLLLLVKSYCCW